MPRKTLEAHEVPAALVVSLQPFVVALESSLARNVVEDVGLGIWASVIGNLWDLGQKTSPSEVQAQSPLVLPVEGYPPLVE